MTLNDYQQGAARTMAPTTGPLQLAVLGLGLAGEAGEVVEIIKKAVGHGHELDREKLAKELGDLAWYLAAIATHLGLDLDAIAEGNLAKLRARYPDGFSKERSINRVEE